jgi:hypothetical protein
VGITVDWAYSIRFEEHDASVTSGRDEGSSEDVRKAPYFFASFLTRFLFLLSIAWQTVVDITCSHMYWQSFGIFRIF